MPSSDDDSSGDGPLHAHQPSRTRRPPRRLQASSYIACQSPGNIRLNHRRDHERSTRIRQEDALMTSHHQNVVTSRAAVTNPDITFIPRYRRLLTYLFPIGTEIEKPFDGVIYRGVCWRYVTRDGELFFYKIIYEDGDEEDLDQEEMTEMAVELPLTATSLIPLSEAVFP